MKKTILSFLVIILLTSVSSANCSQNCGKNPCTNGTGCQKSFSYEQKKDQCQNTINEKEDCTKDKISKRCDKCLIDDDEYCIYNQCFLDKQYRKMKKALCLSKKQETCIDNIYRNFRTDMENLHAKYRIQKNKLLEMIECDNECYKDEVSALKELKNDAKDKCKEFRDDVKEQLCKNQYSDYKRFLRQEKKKMKKIIKYGAVYKFPCVDCCK